MVAPDHARSGLVFDSIIWRRGTIEISFTEERDRGDQICMVKTLILDPQKLPDHYQAFIEALVDFTDEGQVLLRNPPERIRG